MLTVVYRVGAALPQLTYDWLDDDNDPWPFSSGWTFELKLTPTTGKGAGLTKTSAITGADILPNVTVDWSTSGELSTLAPGDYDVQLKATRSSDSKPMFHPDDVKLILKPSH